MSGKIRSRFPQRRRADPETTSVSSVVILLRRFAQGDVGISIPVDVFVPDSVWGDSDRQAAVPFLRIGLLWLRYVALRRDANKRLFGCCVGKTAP